jgi:hypothetical protein
MWAVGVLALGGSVSGLGGVDVGWSCLGLGGVDVAWSCLGLSEFDVGVSCLTLLATVRGGTSFLFPTAKKKRSKENAYRR